MDGLSVILIRFALYADLMLLAGITAFSFYALSAEERASAALPLRRPAIVLALFGFALAGLGMLALVAAMTGSDVWAIDPQAFRAIVFESTIGTAWIVRMVAMALAIVAAVAIDRIPAAQQVLLASTSLAIVTLVWTGHAGATQGWLGTVHRLSDMVHMLASTVWFGGIAVFAWMVFRPLTSQSHEHLVLAHRALEQFSRAGMLAVAAIFATGIVNSFAVVGTAQLAHLPRTGYGRLFLAKLLLFAAMLSLAALNRGRLTPALGMGIRSGNPTTAFALLRRSLIAEGSAAVVILGLVAWLGTLEPLGGPA